MTPVVRTLMMRAGTAPTARERTLLRRLALGHSLEDAALSVGLSTSEANAVLRELQNRFGASCRSRLLALAILRSWV